MGGQGPERHWTTGRIHAVPCPYCSKPNDFRDDMEVLFDGLEGGVETNSRPRFACDHCGREMEVVRAERTVVISLRQVAGGQ